MPPKLTIFFNIFYNFLFYIFIWEKFKNSLNKIIRFSKLHFLVFIEFYRENLIFVLYYAYLFNYFHLFIYCKKKKAGINFFLYYYVQKQKTSKFY